MKFFDAASAYMAGFHAGYQWDGTLDPDEDRDAYIMAEWDEYQVRGGARVPSHGLTPNLLALADLHAPLRLANWNLARAIMNSTEARDAIYQAAARNPLLMQRIEEQEDAQETFDRAYRRGVNAGTLRPN